MKKLKNLFEGRVMVFGRSYHLRSSLASQNSFAFLLFFILISPPLWGMPVPSLCSFLLGGEDSSEHSFLFSARPGFVEQDLSEGVPSFAGTSRDSRIVLPGWEDFDYRVVASEAPTLRPQNSPMSREMSPLNLPSATAQVMPPEDSPQTPPSREMSPLNLPSASEQVVPPEDSPQTPPSREMPPLNLLSATERVMPPEDSPQTPPSSVAESPQDPYLPNVFPEDVDELRYQNLQENIQRSILLTQPHIQLSPSIQAERREVGVEFWGEEGEGILNLEQEPQMMPHAPSEDGLPFGAPIFERNYSAWGLLGIPMIGCLAL